MTKPEGELGMIAGTALLLSIFAISAALVAML